MEKRLRSELQTSPETFLSSITKLKASSDPILKSLIHSIKPSSPLVSSLPSSLHSSISKSLSSFLNPETTRTPSTSPPTKRLRRSSRTKSPLPPSTPPTDVNLKRAKTLNELRVLARVALLCVTHPKQVFGSDQLFPCAQSLHDNLILFESDSGLLYDIASLCEEWWKRELRGRDLLISQSLPVLLSKSMMLNKKVEVRRVYLLREAFLLLDFDDSSIEDLRLLLIRCVVTPLYLKTEEGKKFVSFMFGLSSQVVKEVLAMIKAQIPFGKKSNLEAYGEIVFKAWKSNEEDVKNEIENGLLMGLVEGAIHASMREFGASIRRVLGGFINQKTVEGIEKMLFRLCEPVIFRSLQVANSNVRQNALHLLLDMFPLEDPDATKEAKDTLLDKQYFLLDKLLVDDCPDVRVVAVEGSCRILRLFWEVIPSSTITKMITKIFDDMSHDICNEVRFSVVNGIVYLLGNPQTHELLKVLLPRLGHLMLDSVLYVRASVADLLLFIRDIRSFQFNKVVGLDMLLSTLANDQSLVAQKITKLLLPSYFPQKISPEEAGSRCVTLMKRSPKAGARFCQFLVSEGVSPRSLMHLVAVFINLLLSAEKLGTEQVDGLLAGAAYLCNNLSCEASYTAALKEFLTHDKLKILIAVATSGCAQSSLFSIVSAVGPEDVTGFLEESMGLVMDCTGLSQDLERQAQVRSAHKLVLSCGWFDDMFENVACLLHKTAVGCSVKFGIEIPKRTSPTVNRRKRKSAIKGSVKKKHVEGKKPNKKGSLKFEDEYAIAAGLSWQICDLLVEEDSRKAILQSQGLQLAFTALKVISEASIMQCVQTELIDTSPVLAYTALAMHRSLLNICIRSTNRHDAETDNKYATSSKPNLLDKTIEHLLTCAQKMTKLKGPTEGGLGKITITLKMLSAVLKFIVDATAMGLSSKGQLRCLAFASDYVNYLIIALQKHSIEQEQFKDEDLRKLFLYLKSSCSYTFKLLNVVLSDTKEVSASVSEAVYLANRQLDLIISVEKHLGSCYAARLVSALKPWLPDLVLALGLEYLFKNEGGNAANKTDRGKFCNLAWLSLLAKFQLNEIRKNDRDEESDQVSKFQDMSEFKKLVKEILELVKGNCGIVDSIGLVLLAGSTFGLESKDYGLTLGLVHFACVKLTEGEQDRWGKLKMMLASMYELYSRIEREIDEPGISENGKQNLLDARALLDPVRRMYYSDSTAKDGMLED